MSTTISVQFDESYNKQVIALPVELPKLFDHQSRHQSRVTVGKLTEMYKVMYSFLDGGDQNIVENTVRLPVLNDFNCYNEDYVTVRTLQALYKCLYDLEPPTAKDTSGGATADLG